MEIEGPDLMTLSKKIAKQHPMLPFAKIMKFVERSKGNMVKLMEIINEKESKLHQESRLPAEQIELLKLQFPSLGLPLILKAAKKSTDMQIVRVKLRQMGERGRGKIPPHPNTGDAKGELQNQQQPSQQNEQKRFRHRRRHHKQEPRKQPEPEGVKGAFTELKKLYPQLDDSIIHQEIRKLCRRLDKQLLKPTRPSQIDYQQGTKCIVQVTGAGIKETEKAYKKCNYNIDEAIHYLNANNSGVQTSSTIQPGVTKVVVDGNNLLYINKQIRSVTLKQGKAAGSLYLSNLVNAFSVQKDLPSLLVFDDQRNISALDNVVIKAARPEFATADDYLVSLAQSLPYEARPQHLFVTSDNGLLKRLLDAGCTSLMRSKEFSLMFQS